jgi:hypothetical protein
MPPFIMETSRNPNGIRYREDNLFNIDHGKSLAQHGEMQHCSLHRFSGVTDAKNCLNVSAVAIVIFRYGMDVWLRVGRQAINRPKTARSSKFVRYTVRAWTLNASLTTSSSYRKCSKRRILDHSARATSRLQIEGMTKCWLIVRGSGCGSILASAAEPSHQQTN